MNSHFPCFLKQGGTSEGATRINNGTGFFIRNFS